MTPMRMAARIARRAAVKHIDQDGTLAIDQATREAERRIRKLPPAVLQELLPELVTLAIRMLVNHGRHHYNARLKQEAEGPPAVMREPYMGKAKVKLSHPASLQAAKYCWLNHHIGGRRLGDMTLEDLQYMVENETAASLGHKCNAKLGEALMARLKTGDTVEDRWTSKEIRTIWIRLQPKGRPRRFRRRNKRDDAA